MSSDERSTQTAVNARRPIPAALSPAAVAALFAESSGASVTATLTAELRSHRGSGRR